MAAAAKIGFVILADVASSRDKSDFVEGRDKRLKALSARHHRKQGWVQSAYTVTAWDEFQTYLWAGHAVPRVILELRQRFAPWELRIGIGEGEVKGWRSRRPVNQAVGGAAFENAREALEDLSEPGNKYRRLTCFRTGDEQRDALFDLIYGLHDTLVRDVTERQWETIGYALTGASQEEIASRLGISKSTVSRNLQRGHYWQMQETLAVVSEWLSE